MSEEEAVLALYEVVDRLLRDAAFETVDAEIAAVNVARTSLPMLLGWLSITFAARAELPSRVAFAVAVRARVARERGATGAADVLRGLVEIGR